MTNKFVVNVEQMRAQPLRSHLIKLTILSGHCNPITNRKKGFMSCQEYHTRDICDRCNRV